MGLIDLFRQLYLLLWKNFVLRRRRKLRIIVEIIWPLFLFLILMWVRTRGLRTFEQHCHFAERPLPSGGILPFVRTYICELNYSCSASPRQQPSIDLQLIQFSQLSIESLSILNQNETKSSLTQLVDFFSNIIKQRLKSNQITNMLSLANSSRLNSSDLEQTISNMNLTNIGSNSTLINMILNSNPNFNLFYSNYSQTYQEPLALLKTIGISQRLIDFLYGSNLDLLELNRNRNQITNASWIRSQTCNSNSTNYILNGPNAQTVSELLCNLTDSELITLFTFLSSQIDFDAVKNTVYANTMLSNETFYFEAYNTFLAFENLRTKFSQSGLFSNIGAQSIQNFMAQFQNSDLEKTICGASQLSVFTIYKSLNLNRYFSAATSRLTRIYETNEVTSDLSDLVGDEFELNSKAFQKFDGRVKSLREYQRMSKNDKPTNSRITQNKIQNNNTDTNNNNNNNNINNNEQTIAQLIQMTRFLESINRFNLYTYEKCPFKLPNSDISSFNMTSTTKTCFCQTGYVFIRSMSRDTQFIFQQIKPIFLGKILYTPKTPAYEKLVKRINATFSNMDNIGKFVGNIADILENILVQFNLNNAADIDVFANNIQQTLEGFSTSNSTNQIDIKLFIYQIRFTTQFLKFIRNMFDCFELNKFVGFGDENSAVEAGLSLIDREGFWSVIVFNNPEERDAQTGVPKLPKILSYKIRMNSSHTHDTTFTQDRFYRYGPSNCLGCNAYFLYGFIYLQDMIEKAIIEEKTNMTQNYGITSQMTPYPCYVNDKFVTAISRTLPLFMVLAWIYTVSMMVKDIVYEKEKRLKEFMRVMGLSNGIHWLSWFITSFVTMFFVVFLLCIVIKYGKITQYSELSALVVFFCCFTIATITQCFLISIFFNKANLAAVVAGIIYFLLYLPYTLLVNYSEVILPWQKFLASLSSTVAFSYGCELIASFELQVKGLQWSNFYRSPFVTQDGFSMNTICLILLFDACIYMVLAWYIENIAPGEYGIALKWYFPLTPSYWFGESHCITKRFNRLTSSITKNRNKSKTFLTKLFGSCWFDSKQKVIQQEEERQEAMKKANGNNKMLDDSIENAIINEQAGIEIEKLHKVYSRGNNHALKGLSIKFYKNEITAFLGHNGAGKSTTMHILTGLYSPTSGTAKINGLDIRISMNSIRKSLGFVPQHNVLFPGLTVKEHLWFYARLKGLDRKSTKIEMEKMLDDTGLRPKKSELSKNLSGGMQRKLSVAIAFVGGSKTVILDEPSAGVDPSGRRSIWDLLFKFRKDRTIIISTHHMDEADVLGDRIAIISNGKLIAHGSAYFLKHKYGRGYYLTFAKKQLTNEEFKVLSPNNIDLNNNNDTASSKSSSSDSGMSLDSKVSLTPPQSNEELRVNRIVSKQDIDLIVDKKLKQVKNENQKEEDDEVSESFEQIQEKNNKKALETLKSDQDKEIHFFVTSRIENAILVENIGTEMTYSISNKPEFTKSYENVFHQIEKNMNRMGIESVGISDTTLEEIFIKLAKEPKKNKFKHKEVEICGINFTKIKEKIKKSLCCCFKKKPMPVLTEEQLNEYSKYTKLRVNSKFTLVSRQLVALLIKRFHRVKRNIKGFFAEIVLPVIFVCLALLVAILTPKPTQRPSLELHPYYYGSPNQVFFSKSSSIEYDTPIYKPSQSYIELGLNTKINEIQPNLDEINKITATFLQTFGTRCMAGHQIVITQQAEDYGRANGNKILDCNNYNYIVNNNYSMPSQSFVNELIQTNFSFTKKSIDCDCSAGFPECPQSAGGDFKHRNIFTLRTKDILYDLTGRNISDFLVKTEFDELFFRKRFGGYEFLKPNIQTDSQTPINLIGNITSFMNTINFLLNRLNLSSTTATNSVLSQISNINFDGSNPLISPKNVKIWYNPKGYDSSVSYLNYINNALLRSKINELNSQNISQQNTNYYMNPAEHGIVAYNHPMNFTKTQFLDQLEKRILIDLFVAICMIFALSFIPASFLVFLLEEREANIKQLQFVSGVKPYIYWISNFIWDLINYIVPCFLCIIIFFAFDVKSYTSQENFPYLISLMLLYGWGCIPLMYPLNYLFKLPSTAFVVSSSMNVFIGVISTMATSILDQLGDDEPDLLVINSYLKPIFVVLFPHYCLGQGFLEMSLLYNTAQAQSILGINKKYTPFDFNKGGKNLLALSIQGIVFFILNLLIQYQFFIRFKPTNNLKKLNLPVPDYVDDDVANERDRILNLEMKNNSNKANKKKRIDFLSTSQNNLNNMQNYEKNNNTDFIKLVNLTKIYTKFRKFRRWKKHVAVNAVSLGIKKGECFGLIGVNGAGKTTTFKMITGEIPITGGDVYVNNYSVSKQIEKVHENIGYCPQTDAIMPLLTAREHLIFFARLRGIPEKYVKQVCDWALNRVGLTVFSNRISGDFSGGNKRKLSTAIALVGDPSVICLDEPTSGMDAKARRLLWNDILSLIKENRIVILTSHSMEECEALCTRLVIMVNGQFKCLGSPQHLKRKFGSGFKLVFRLNDENDKDVLFDFMKTKFPTALIQESHKNLFEFILPFRSNKLSEIFGKIEKHRQSLNLKDYSVSQTTLDQIFVSFAKGQNEDPFNQSNNLDVDDQAAKNLQNLLNNQNEYEIIQKSASSNENSIRKNSNVDSYSMHNNNDEENIDNKNKSSNSNEKLDDLSNFGRDIQYYIEPIRENSDVAFSHNTNKVDLKDVYETTHL